MTKETINIHGKAYETVASRVNRFRADHELELSIDTMVIHHDKDTVIVSAKILRNGVVIGSGHGEESRTSSQINRTSALENAETSAIGRALASIGYLGTEYSSANEVTNAIHQQETMPKPQKGADVSSAPSKYIPSGKGINEKQGNLVKARLKQHGVSWADFSSHYGIEKMSELPWNKMDECLQWIEDAGRENEHHSHVANTAAQVFADDMDQPF